MGRNCSYGPVLALCQPTEIHQRARNGRREMEQKEKREADGGSQPVD